MMMMYVSRSVGLVQVRGRDRYGMHGMNEWNGVDLNDLCLIELIWCALLS